MFKDTDTPHTPIQRFKYTDFDICLCYIVIKYKKLPSTREQSD